jgi:hypothetical protein
MHLDVYASDPDYPADGATNDTIFLDNTGILYLGGGTMRAENASAGAVLRGPVTFDGSATLGGVTRTNWPTEGTGSGEYNPGGVLAATNTGTAGQMFYLSTAGGTNTGYFADAPTGSAYDDAWTNDLAAVAFAGEVDPVWGAASNSYLLTADYAPGISHVTATNIAYAPGVPTVALVSEATVTVPRTEGVLYYRLTLTNSTTLRIATNLWTSTEVGRFSIDIVAGAQTLAFNTADMSGTTVLDVNTNAGAITPLFFRKPAGAIQWRVRQ